MASDPLLEHIRDTYSRLRRGMAVIAFLLPLVLWFVGRLWFDTALQPSMSAYYHATDDLRDIFVGVLFAVGTFLFLYKGESAREDWLLNVAGISALCIAYFEMEKDSDCSATGPGITAHGFFAVVFFVAIAWVCISVALRTQKPAYCRYVSRHALWYNACAAVMIVSILVGLTYTFLLPAPARLALCERSIIFWVEAFSVWAFSVFWILRTVELDAHVSWWPWPRKSKDHRRTGEGEREV